MLDENKKRELVNNLEDKRFKIQSEIYRYRNILTFIVDWKEIEKVNRELLILEERFNFASIRINSILNNFMI